MAYYYLKDLIKTRIYIEFNDGQHDIMQMIKPVYLQGVSNNFRVDIDQYGNINDIEGTRKATGFSGTDSRMCLRSAGVPKSPAGTSLLKIKQSTNIWQYTVKTNPTWTEGGNNNVIEGIYLNGSSFGDLYLASEKNVGIGFFENPTTHDIYPIVMSVNNFATDSIQIERVLRPIGYTDNHIDIVGEDPYTTAPVNDNGEGGYGDFNYTSDNDDIPSLPTLSVTDAGFANLFKLDGQGVKDLADYLWSGLFDISTYLKLFSDPMDCILSLAIVPFDPPAGSNMYIVVGNHATTIQAPRVTDQWFELDCGSVEVDGADYSNSFMDYSPYTSAQLYLPYIGTVALDTDEIMDATIAIKYHIDLFSGSCVAYVKVSKNYTYKGEEHTHTNVLYQYSGNVLTNIPITSQNFTQVFSAVIGAVATGVSGGAAGAGVATGAGEAAAASGEGAAIATAMQLKPPVHRSGNCSSACGLLGTQKPKLMLTLPKLVNPKDMNKERGYPSYMRKTLSDLSGSGYTKIDLAHLKGIPCTDRERDEIITLLEGGVEL